MSCMILPRRGQVPCSPKSMRLFQDLGYVRPVIVVMDFYVISYSSLSNLTVWY